MGLETFFFSFLTSEFGDAIKPADGAVPTAQYSNDRDTLEWVVIVEMTPFIKSMSIDRATGQDYPSGHAFFVKKIKPIIERYRQLGYKTEHLVYDNGAPSAKYGTHAKRYSKGHSVAYPKTLSDFFEHISCCRDYTVTVTATATTNEGDETSDLRYVSTVSDKTMIKAKSWKCFLNNKSVTNDIISYLTNKIALSPLTAEFANNAGVFNSGSEDDVVRRRTIVPPNDSEIRIYCGITEHQPYANSGEMVLSRKDDSVLVVKTDGTTRSNDVFSKESLKRTKEGEMTCGMIAYDVIFQKIDAYLEALSQGRDIERPSDRCRILIDSVDGDLVDILLYVYEYSIFYARKRCNKLGLSTQHAENALPRWGVWLRMSGKSAPRARLQEASYQPGQSGDVDDHDLLNDVEIPVCYDEFDDPYDNMYARLDWRDARTERSSFSPLQFKNKDTRLPKKEKSRSRSRFDDDEGDSLIESDCIPFKITTTTTTRQNNNDYSIKQTFQNANPYDDNGDDEDDDNFNLLCQTRTSSGTFGISNTARRGSKLHGSYVDINTLYANIQKHDVFSNMIDPTSTLVLVSALCGNDFIQKSVPGLTTGKDDRNRPFFFLPFLYEREFDDLVSVSFQKTKHRLEEGGKYMTLVKASISDNKFRDYIHTVYYYKYRDTKAVIEKAQRLYAARYTNKHVVPKLSYNANSKEERQRLERLLMKKCYVEVILERLATLKNKPLTDEQMSGLKARLTWFLEYTASAPLNNGYYPNPLLVRGSKSVYGWKSVRSGDTITTSKNTMTDSLDSEIKRYDEDLSIEETNDVVVDAYLQKWYDDVTVNYGDMDIENIKTIIGKKKEAERRRNAKDNIMSDAELYSYLQDLEKSNSTRPAFKNRPSFESIFLSNVETTTDDDVLSSHTKQKAHSEYAEKDAEKEDSRISELASTLGFSLVGDDDDDHDNDNDEQKIHNVVEEMTTEPRVYEALKPSFVQETHTIDENIETGVSKKEKTSSKRKIETIDAPTREKIELELEENQLRTDPKKSTTKRRQPSNSSKRSKKRK